jgi:hypothetical protein
VSSGTNLAVEQALGATGCATGCGPSQVHVVIFKVVPEGQSISCILRQAHAQSG